MKVEREGATGVVKGKKGRGSVLSNGDHEPSAIFLAHNVVTRRIDLLVKGSPPFYLTPVSLLNQ